MLTSIVDPDGRYRFEHDPAAFLDKAAVVDRLAHARQDISDLCSRAHGADAYRPISSRHGDHLRDFWPRVGTRQTHSSDHPGQSKPEALSGELYGERSSV